MNTTYKHTIVDILVGLSFPVFALFIDCMYHEIEFSWVGIVTIHKINVIHFVVDSAPIFLGLAGLLPGKSNHKKSNINKEPGKINRFLDVRTHKITHGLRGSVLKIKGLVDIIKTTPPKNKEEDKNELLAKPDNSINLWLDTITKFMELLRQEKAGLKTKSVCVLKGIIDSLENDLNLNEKKGKSTTIFEDYQIVFALLDDLSNIFKNLLSNSLKYAHPNKPPDIVIKSIR